jgi:glutamine synthetase
MRKKGGIEAINAAVDKLSKSHAEHIAEYGTGNELRLTGRHETVRATSLLETCLR